MNPAQSNADT